MSLEKGTVIEIARGGCLDWFFTRISLGFLGVETHKVEFIIPYYAYSEFETVIVTRPHFVFNKKQKIK